MMNLRLRPINWILASLIACWCLPPARAGVLTFSLNSATMSISPNGSVQFTGTLTNPGVNNVFLNGDVSALPFSHLTVDDSPFFTFSPLFLPGGGMYSGPFFNVSADAALLPGTYTGSFTIQGGADSNAFDNLAVQTFVVKFSPAASLPEPRISVLIAVGLVLIAAVRRLNPTA